MRTRRKLEDVAVFGTRSALIEHGESSFHYLLNGVVFTPTRAIRRVMKKKRCDYTGASLYLGRLVLAAIRKGKDLPEAEVESIEDMPDTPDYPTEAIFSISSRQDVIWKS